jgi:hypothetical protein
MWLIYSRKNGDKEIRSAIPEKRVELISSGIWPKPGVQPWDGALITIEGIGGYIPVDRFDWASSPSAAAIFVRKGWDAMVNLDEKWGASSAPNQADERTCRVCGCTDDDCSQCIEATGEPCSWAEDDLCSRCLDEGIEALKRDGANEADIEAAVKSMTSEEWRTGGPTSEDSSRMTGGQRKAGDEWENDGRKLRYVPWVDRLGPTLAVLDVEANQIIATRDASCIPFEHLEPGEMTIPPAKEPEPKAFTPKKWRYRVVPSEGGKYRVQFEAQGPELPKWVNCQGKHLGVEFADCQAAVDAVMMWSPSEVEAVNVPEACVHDQAHAMAAKPPEDTSQA